MRWSFVVFGMEAKCYACTLPESSKPQPLRQKSPTIAEIAAEFYSKIVDVWVINLANAPSVVGKHLDDECLEDFIKGLILFVSSFFHVERRFAEPLDGSPSLPYLIFWNPAKFLPLFYEAAHMAQEVVFEACKSCKEMVLEESLHMHMVMWVVLHWSVPMNQNEKWSLWLLLVGELA
ncbi:uncharacterized protein LOC126409884 [Nymphaea colorata]|uniref:uncharacterized protein LOC126409884 n=1 Tax=Nymphaea colorata TaxID=210225 RepID=UPI00214EF3FF|nr:uncharacterized protein LOC126409884 [Nymphaea colorata]